MIVTLECGTASKKIELMSPQTLVGKIWKDVFVSKDMDSFPFTSCVFILHIAIYCLHLLTTKKLLPHFHATKSTTLHHTFRVRRFQPRRLPPEVVFFVLYVTIVVFAAPWHHWTVWGYGKRPGSWARSYLGPREIQTVHFGRSRNERLTQRQITSPEVEKGKTCCFFLGWFHVRFFSGIFMVGKAGVTQHLPVRH